MQSLARPTHALAAAVDPSTSVAEVIPAPARHMVASSAPLNPELAAWTLLVLLTFYEFEEFVVSISVGVVDSIFSACHADVEGLSAIQAKMVVAEWADKLYVFVENERVFAVWGRTPRDIFLQICG